MEPSSLLTAFHRDGYVVLSGALAPSSVSSFVDDIESDLPRAGRALGLSGSLSLRHPRTWPRRNQRRVLECVALGGARPHWDGLRSSPVLAAALDTLLGAGGWEIPANAVDDDDERAGRVKSAAGPGGAAASAVADDDDREEEEEELARQRDPTGAMRVRHWYCPVTFPEQEVKEEEEGEEEAKEGAAAAPTHPGPPLPCAGPRLAALTSVDEEVRTNGMPTPSTAAHRWQPVNRRRFLNKGWHVDVGPGFPNPHPRSPRGDYRQGVILLVLLSDCEKGAGGTALIPGSHDWCMRRLLAEEGKEMADAAESPAPASPKRRRAEGEDGAGAAVATEADAPAITPTGAAPIPPAPRPGGVSHEALNSWAVDVLRLRTEEGRVLVPCACGACAPAGPPPSSDLGPAPCTRDSTWVCPPGLREEATACGVPSLVSMAQVVGRAGDVVLVHPLLVHSGTTNCGARPRLLANGVARVRKGVFLAPTESGGRGVQCPILARDRARLGGGEGGTV
jgi:hypothetical protein